MTNLRVLKSYSVCNREVAEFTRLSSSRYALLTHRGIQNHGKLMENLIRKNFTPSEAVAVKHALEPEIKEEHLAGRPKKGADSAQFGKKTR